MNTDVVSLPRQHQPSAAPTDLRARALDLIRQADMEDGGNTLSSFITRGEMVSELLAAREELQLLREKVAAAEEALDRLTLYA